MTATMEHGTSTAVHVPEYVTIGSDGTRYLWEYTAAERRQVDGHLRKIANGGSILGGVKTWCCGIGPRRTPCPIHRNPYKGKPLPMGGQR